MNKIIAEPIDHHIRNSLQILMRLQVGDFDHETLDEVVLEIEKHLIDLTLALPHEELTASTIALQIVSGQIESLMDDHEAEDVQIAKENLEKLYGHLRRLNV